MPTEPLQSSETITSESYGHAYASGFRLTIRFLLSKGANIDQAEEVAQTAWARGWEARKQLQSQERVLPWVNSIAFHRLCNTHRQAAKISELLEMADPRAGTSSSELDASTLLKLCPPIDRNLMTQRYLEGRNIKEIASAHGLSEVAVRVRLHRCQRSLRSNLNSGPSPHAQPRAKERAA